MKILFLTKYGDLSASSRLRAFQYQAKIDKVEHTVDVQSLFDNKYLLRRFKSSKIIVINKAIYGFIKRLFFLLKVRQYDTLIIHLELFPYMPPIFEYLLFKTSKKIYFDYDDAIFHSYDKSNNMLVRFFFGNKIKFLMRRADGVICCNKYLENYAIRSGAKRILILPTVINLSNYALDFKRTNSNHHFTIGWIGSSSTTKYLDIVREPIARLAIFYPITLYLVGSDVNFSMTIKNVKIKRVEWSEANEQKALKEFDVGIMPLYDDWWDKGKCAFKLIQYMGSFVPVVASGVGMNVDIVNKSGFIANNSSEWLDAIKKIFDDVRMREEMGQAGRKTIENGYTIKTALPALINFIDFQNDA